MATPIRGTVRNGVPNGASGPDGHSSLLPMSMMVGATFCIAGLEASAKYLVMGGMSALFLSWCRFLIHLILLFMVFRVWQDPKRFMPKNWVGQIVRGILLYISTQTTFGALRSIQISELVTIMFLSPMTITALAGPFLGEWATRRGWITVGIGLTGILIAMRPGFAVLHWGHLEAFIAMATYALYVLITRKISATETNESLLVFSGLVPVLLLLPVVVTTMELPQTGMAAAILLVAGLFGFASSMLVVKAYTLAPASSLAPLAYLQLPWTVAAGYLIFGNWPDYWMLAGAAIIIAGGLFLANGERSDRLRAAKPSMA